MYWGREGEFTTYENVISVIYNGAIAAGKVYAQKDKTGILAESYFIKIKNYDCSHNINIFLAAILEKTLYYKYSRDYLATWDGKVENDTIQLPVKNGKIDFDFMENFITELEAQRMAELEAYLSVTGLKNTHLSPEEEQALRDFDKIIFKDFKLTDVFEVKNTRNILSRDIKENSGKTPYLCASADNNAVASYISYKEEFKNKGNCVFIGGKTFVVTYQEKDFFSNDSHNIALYLKDTNNQEKYNQLYLVTCVYSSLYHKYSWGDSISNKKAQKDYIALPAKNGVIDFECMATLISAVQKLVIKDVIAYSDSKFNTTKTVVNK